MEDAETSPACLPQAGWLDNKGLILYFVIPNQVLKQAMSS
jgi:hypothetical protein